jgi:hypothetical protein
MSTRDDLLELERDAWRARSTDGEAAATYYERMLAEKVLMLLPGGLVELSDEHVLELDDRTAVVAYRARAKRSNQGYEALFNSTYVRANGAWRLALHQQTPV